MSETTSEQTPSAEAAAPAAASTRPPASQRAGTALAWLAIVLIVLAGAGAAAGLRYLDQAQRRSARDAQANIDALGSRLEALDRRLGAGDARTSALEQKLDDGLQKLADSQKAISQSLAQIADRQPKSYDQWRLQEAAYLIGIAEQRLLLERDVSTAIAAMEAADARLGESRDPSFIPIREQVIADLNALRAVKPVDIAGLALYLADLIDRVDSLPLRDSNYEIRKKEEGGRPKIDNWRDLVHSLWQDLVKLVAIKDMSVPDDVVFDPGKRYLLQFNLSLELAAARLQVMRYDTDNFRASLKHVQTVLERYYDTGNQQVANVIETLVKMQEIDLAPPLPDIDKSLQRVRERIARLRDNARAP